MNNLNINITNNSGDLAVSLGDNGLNLGGTIPSSPTINLSAADGTASFADGAAIIQANGSIVTDTYFWSKNTVPTRTELNSHEINSVRVGTIILPRTGRF